MKKTDGKQKMDCHRALHNGRGAFIAGGLFALVGAFLLVADFPQKGGVVLAVGAALMVIGTVIYTRCCVCPHCGKRFAEGFRMIAEVPAICPNCSRKVPGAVSEHLTKEKEDDRDLEEEREM